MYSEIDRQAALLADLHRRQHRVLPAALPRACGHAAPHRRLSGCLRRLELRVLDRLVHLGRSALIVFFYRRGACLHAQGAGRRQSVGRGRDHARMDAAVAAAVPPVRRAAADQVSDRTDVADERKRRARRIRCGPSVRAEPSMAGVGDYLALMKPRVMSLVVFTALVGLVIAPGASASGDRLHGAALHRGRRRRRRRAQHVVRRRHRRGDDAHRQPADSGRPRRSRARRWPSA